MWGTWAKNLQAPAYVRLVTCITVMVLSYLLYWLKYQYVILPGKWKYFWDRDPELGKIPAYLGLSGTVGKSAYSTTVLNRVG